MDFAGDNTDPDLGTHFNNANESTCRNITTGGSPVTPDYDANGNLIDDGKDYLYTYDAWNRLTKIENRSTNATVTEYRYNGLGHRIAEGDGTDTEHLIYDDRWRLISRHDGSSAYLEETLYHQAGLDGYGGASDVDSVIMRRTFLSTGSPQTENQRWYVLQNWRQDVVAIIDEAAVQRERVFYSPYGRVFGMVAGDTGFDGHYGTGDSTAISGWAANSHPYRAYADVDLDGTIDATDAGYTTNASMGWDVLSRDGSTVGATGATFSKHIPVMGFLIAGVYHAELGRMVHRGMNGGGVGFGEPCYSPTPCGCTVGGDSTFGGCGGGPVFGPGPIDVTKCGGGESLADVLSRCWNTPEVRQARDVWDRSCGGKQMPAMQCRDCGSDGSTLGLYCCGDNSIRLCSESGPVSCTTLAHEYLHAADSCHRTCTTFGNPCMSFDIGCKSSACDEIRAYALDGSCCDKDELSGEWRDCVVERAKGSTPWWCDCFVAGWADCCLPTKAQACDRTEPFPVYPSECGKSIFTTLCEVLVWD